LPAKSVAQQQFFAICEHDPQHAKGKCPNMSKEKMSEFASTSTTGLPQYKKKNSLKTKMGY